jgi:hypothetical protein
MREHCHQPNVCFRPIAAISAAPIADTRARRHTQAMSTEMTFREYLERRQSGDAAVREFMTVRDPSILERRSWADLMWAFRAEGADSNYISTARRFHHEYSRALDKSSR